MGMNISIDVESDGPAPGIHSIVSFGAVIVEPGFKRTFYGELAPISTVWIPEALAVSGFTREQHNNFEDPAIVMERFAKWISENSKGRPIFWSDNNGYDFAFMNYYFHRFYGSNPFGWSSQNIGSLYKGIVGDFYKKFKHLRDTRHTHNPVDDAKGNAEALQKMFDHMNGIKSLPKV